jgi:hypothetical protein
LQGPSCNHQIPAKAYEYLRLRRPILALTAPAGDTAGLLRDAGGATIVDLTDEATLRTEIRSFLDMVRAGSHPLPVRQRVEGYARHHQAQQLAACLDEVVRTQRSSPEKEWRC